MRRMNSYPTTKRSRERRSSKKNLLRKRLIWKRTASEEKSWRKNG